MKTRVINILPHKPDYDYLQDKPRPKVNWDTPGGQWVGIYRNEIPDKLGEEILKYTDEYEYEVWQTDYRADKMYTHRFEDGLVHRLFPAEDVNELHGLKLRKVISSPVMIAFLKKYAKDHSVIINLNGDFCHINFEILDQCPKLPILQTFRGTLYLPKNQIFKVRKNVPAALSYYLKHLKVKKLIRNIDSVMVQNSFYLNDLKEMYKGPIKKLTSGCEFDVWQPMERQEARKSLDLPADRKVFFTSSLLIPIKQLDKLMEVLSPLSREYDFLLLVSGHGTPEYEAYLKEKAKDLLAQDKIRFVGYLTGEDLRRHYCASDLFVHTSISEGGPVAAMKAIACGTPVLITKIANVAEELAKDGSGKLIDPFDYEEWTRVFKAILEGEKVKAYPREKAAKMYDWQAVAGEFVKTFHELEKKSPSTQRQKEEAFTSAH